MNDAPSDNTLITIYGWRCSECGAESEEKFNQWAIDDWKRKGIGEWLEGRDGWPLQLPAWMVRAGFICRHCRAYPPLMALTPEVPR